VKLPEGYFITYEGEFQAQKEATQRIAIFSSSSSPSSPSCSTATSDAFFALQVLCDIPLALVGGLVFTYFKLNNISIATLVGFIAVGGVAARNSIMLISTTCTSCSTRGRASRRRWSFAARSERWCPCS
jgi:Cu/Ag efflux pump CusA